MSNNELGSVLMLSELPLHSLHPSPCASPPLNTKKKKHNHHHRIYSNTTASQFTIIIHPLQEMGNIAAAFCAPSMISSPHGVVKVLFSNGTLQVYTKPVKAGELMVECSGHFVCDSRSLKVGQRVQGLLADDEELERRQLYFLLPMDLLYSVMTSEEMGSLTRRATRALKNNNSNFVRIFPVLSEFCMFPNNNNNSEAKTTTTTMEEYDDEGSGNNGEDDDERYCKQRSWKPALETIVETSTPPRPVC